MFQSECSVDSNIFTKRSIGESPVLKELVGVFLNADLPLTLSQYSEFYESEAATLVSRDLL